MSRLNSVAIPLALAAVLAGPSLAAAEKPATAAALVVSDTPNKCAFVRSINGWSYVDDKTIVVETNPSNRFKVSFTIRCHDLDTALGIAIDGRGSSCLRSGDAIVPSRSGIGFHQRCTVAKVEHLAPRQQAGLEQP